MKCRKFTPCGDECIAYDKFFFNTSVKGYRKSKNFLMHITYCDKDGFYTMDTDSKNARVKYMCGSCKKIISNVNIKAFLELTSNICGPSCCKKKEEPIIEEMEVVYFKKSYDQKKYPKRDYIPKYTPKKDFLQKKEFTFPVKKEIKHCIIEEEEDDEYKYFAENN